MLQLVNIAANTYFRYRPRGSQAAPETVLPGVYYLLYGNLCDHDKKRFPSVAATDDHGRFCRLLPPDRWIKTILDGFIPPEMGVARDAANVDVDDIETLTEIAAQFRVPLNLVQRLRTWQRRELCRVLLSYQKLGYARIGCIAPLSAGKTLFGLIACRLVEPALVAAPRHLHSEWREQAERWALACPAITTPESLHKIGPEEYASLLTRA